MAASDGIVEFKEFLEHFDEIKGAANNRQCVYFDDESNLSVYKNILRIRN